MMRLQWGEKKKKKSRGEDCKHNSSPIASSQPSLLTCGTFSPQQTSAASGTLRTFPCAFSGLTSEKAYLLLTLLHSTVLQTSPHITFLSCRLQPFFPPSPVPDPFLPAHAQAPSGKARPFLRAVPHPGGVCHWKKRSFFCTAHLSSFKAKCYTVRTKFEASGQNVYCPLYTLWRNEWEAGWHGLSGIELYVHVSCAKTRAWMVGLVGEWAEFLLVLKSISCSYTCGVFMFYQKIGNWLIRTSFTSYWRKFLTDEGWMELSSVNRAKEAMLWNFLQPQPSGVSLRCLLESGVTLWFEMSVVSLSEPLKPSLGGGTCSKWFKKYVVGLSVPWLAGCYV